LNKKLEQALNNAIASISMEGYVFTDKQKQICADVLDGKITKEEYIKMLLQKNREMLN